MTRFLFALLALLTATPAFAVPPAQITDQNGNPLGTQANPLVTTTPPNAQGVPTTPGACAIAATIIVTGTGGILIAANPARKSLRWMNVGAADITVTPGTSAPVVGQGMVYASTAAGKQGGSETFNDPAVATNAFSFAAAASATAAVWECQ